MRAIVHIGHHLHILAPSVAAASKLTELLSRCRVMDRTVNRETAEWEYVQRDGEQSALAISVDVIAPSRVRSRVPKARRLTAPRVDGNEDVCMDRSPNDSASATPGEGGQHGS